MIFTNVVMINLKMNFGINTDNYIRSVLYNDKKY